MKLIKLSQESRRLRLPFASRFVTREVSLFCSKSVCTSLLRAKNSLIHTTSDTFLDQFLIRNDGLNFEDAGSIGRLAPRSCMTVSLPSTIGLEDSKNQVTVTARPIDENGNALAYHAQLVTANAESTIKVRKMKAD